MSKQSGSHYSKHQPAHALQQTVEHDMGVTLPVPLRSPSKTKYTRHSSENQDHPDIYASMKITVRVNEGQTCKGYLGCVVLDWHERNIASKWSWSTKIICQVVGASQDEHKDMIGHLICCEVYSWSSSFWGGFGIAEMSGKNWSKYGII